MISPIDIRQQTFGKAIRGYDPDEVKNYLTGLSQEWEQVLDKNRELKTELEKTQSSLRQYQEMETLMRNTLMQAERSSNMTVEAAKRDGQLIVKEAEQKATSVVNKAIEEKSRLEQQLNDLILRRQELLGQINGFLMNQIERLKTFEGYEMLGQARPMQPVYKPETEPPAPPIPPPTAPAVVTPPAVSLKEVVQPQPAVPRPPVQEPVASFFEQAGKTSLNNALAGSLAEEL
jgi:cell division initiation protein